MFLNFAALALLPLADATAIGFATPLISVALAALMLGEVVRIFRWSAVCVGLVGVLVMLSPHLGRGATEAASGLGALLALAGAFVVALAMTQVRHLASTETTGSLVFYFSVVCSLGGLATLPWGWIVPSPGDLAALIATGILGGVGQMLITESYRHAPAAVLAPFAYTAMIWSVAIGYFWFGEVPEPVVLAGAGIVIAAGLVVIFRERRLGIERAAERRAGSPPSGPAV
jgi:drug/metabolite transporter (DMT)-like permease